MIDQHEQIRQILMQDWDPIGVGDMPEAADEYDRYAFEIFVALKSGKGEVEIRDYLAWAEGEHMGGTVDTQRAERVAARILRTGEVKT